MTPKSLLLIASLLAIAPVAASAQDERNDSGRDRGDNPAVGQAVERSAPAPAPPPPPRAEAPAPAPPQAVTTPSEQRRNGSRDRGDNPPIGRAVPRDSAPAPAPPPRGGIRNDGRYRGGGIYVAPPTYNYYYYPRRYYPYGYGAFGLGYFYYDPYTWYPPSYYPGYYGGFDPYFFDRYDTGELRLDVSPRYADVYVDGYFAGRVDDYDGVFQALRLEGGPHHIQIVAPGFAPLDFDVRIEPGRKITYRGSMQPFRP